MPPELPQKQPEKSVPKQVTQRDLYDGALKRVIHDVRSPLGTIHNVAAVLRMKHGDSTETTILERTVKSLTHLLREVHDESMAAMSIQNFRAMLEEVLKKIADARTAMLPVQISSFPSELFREQIPVNPVIWQRILTNLLDNATRKGATVITISLRQASFNTSGLPCMELSFQDDGEGMSPDILEKIQAGLQASDRECLGELPEGDTSDHRGQGLLSIRRAIEQLSHGEMDIQSMQATDADASRGTTITFRLPLLNGHHHPEHQSPVVAAIPSEAVSQTVDYKRSNRRQALRLLVGGGTAAALGVAGFKAVSRRSISDAVSEDQKFMPLHAVSVGPDGRISFALNVGGEVLEYTAGKEHPAFRNVSHLRHEDLSFVGFELQVTPDESPEKLFLCHSPEGTFGYLKVLQGTATRTGYVCCPEVREDQQNAFFTLDDTILDAHLYATSEALLRSPHFSVMTGPLRKFSGAPSHDDRTQRQWMNRVRVVTGKLLSLHQRALQAGVPVPTDEDWKECLRTAQNKFLLVEPPVQKKLLTHPESPRDIDRLRTHGNSFCFKGMTVPEAQRLVLSVKRKTL